MLMLMAIPTAGTRYHIYSSAKHAHGCCNVDSCSSRWSRRWAFWTRATACV